MLFARIALFVFVMFSTPSFGQVDEAIQAYESGDYDNAFRIINAAAKEGQANAQFYLGESYFNGRGAPQDFSQAIRWYEKVRSKGIKMHR